jgi:flavin reductase (DIM6/NTAB) family NADH-FMN oxidoreductase RutF
MVKPARVADAAFALECTLHQAVPIGEEHMMLLIGHVRRVHARTDVLLPDRKTVDGAKLAPVSRLGGNTYARLGEVYDIPRPVWKKEIEAVTAAIAQKQSQL